MGITNEFHFYFKILRLVNTSGDDQSKNFDNKVNSFHSM